MSRTRERRARRFIALGTFLTGMLLSGLPTALALDPNRRISQYAHTAWRVRDGDFAGAPDAITQTTDGYMWIGTAGGLVRFDGVRFVPWLPPAGKQLLSPNISALLGARDGSLWIGTDVGLSRWKDGDLINYSDPMGFISDIQEGRNGTIWLSRSNLNDDKGSLCEVVDTKLRCHGKSDGLPSLVGGPLICDVRGNVWTGSSSMLTRWKQGSSSTYAIKGLESGADFTGVQALASAPDGSLMVGMTRPGPTLGLQEFVGGVWKAFVVPGLDGRNLAIDALFLDREKALWIGTSAEGLYRVYDGTVDHFRGVDGLTGEAVYGFYEDNEGDVWAVTSGGLDRFRDFQVTSFSTREGLKADGVQTVLASRNGTLWVGNFATLDSLHDGRISSIGRKDGLPGEHPSSMFEDHAGRLWVGVDSELSVYEKGKFTRIRRPDGSPVGRAVALAEDKDGDLWVESYGPPKSLLRIRDFKVLEELRSPGIPYAASLTADPEGGIWLGLVNGDLARYRNGQLSTYNFHLGQNDSRVRRVEVRPDGTVLGATPIGVIGWHDGKKQILSSRNGLPCDFIYTEDRRRAEQEREKLRELEADLAHINRVSMMGEMAASLAHEIKQPITAAITSANSCIEWLTREPPNLDRARAAASKIDKYGNRAAEIIDRMRSFYRKSPPRRELVGVNGIIQEILTLLYGEATRSLVSVCTELAADLPGIMADRVQLQQVLMNLMLNAIEAMQDKGGELTVMSQLQDGQLLFSVSDTGPGLPAGNVDQIFSAFFTTKPQGSGMGLAISRSIVESHGGRLWASANDGRGATFHFTLPTEVP